MKRAADLSREELVGIVDSMQAWLWLDIDNRGDFWNPEKIQDQDTYDHMASVLENVGLKPEEPIRVQPEFQFGSVVALRSLEPEEAVLTAQTELLGVPHHVYFVQVQETPNGLEPVKDPAGRLEDVERQLGEGRPQTVELPGRPGRYVVSLLPHEQ